MAQIPRFCKAASKWKLQPLHADDKTRCYFWGGGLARSLVVLIGTWKDTPNFSFPNSSSSLPLNRADSQKMRRRNSLEGSCWPPFLIGLVSEFHHDFSRSLSSSKKEPPFFQMVPCRPSQGKNGWNFRWCRIRGLRVEVSQIQGDIQSLYLYHLLTFQTGSNSTASSKKGIYEKNQEQ